MRYGSVISLVCVMAIIALAVPVGALDLSKATIVPSSSSGVVAKAALLLQEAWA